MLKFFSIAVIVLWTLIVLKNAYLYYSHKGCQVTENGSKVLERSTMTVASLVLVTLVGCAFWAELCRLANFMTCFETADVISFNVVALLMAAYGYYLGARYLAKRVMAISYENARALAADQKFRCKRRCLAAEAGQASLLHCRNLDVVECPCAQDWDIRTAIRSREDICDAMSQVKIPEFGCAEIGVHASRVVVKRPTATILSKEIEQQYIAQIINLVATTLPDGTVRRKLVDQETERSIRVR